MDIEGIAVTALKNNILLNPLLRGYDINENDKTPSWDGDIFVYNKLDKNDSYKKGNIKGKVPIQIKGKKVKKLQGDSIKYPLNKDDLRNYYTDGGAIFFVVEFISPSKNKIYYAQLLPFDLKQILEEMGTQKSKTYEFTVLPSEDYSLTKLCQLFLLHRRKQPHNVLNSSVPINDKSSGRFKFSIPLGVNPQDTFLNYDMYIYQTAKLKTNESITSVDIPIKKGRITSLLEYTNLTIGINKKVIFNDVMLETGKNKKTLKFSRGFQLDIKELDDGKNEKLNIKFKEKGTFKERLKDCQFMYDILKQKEIEINEETVNINHNHDDMIVNLPEHINYLKENIQVFEELNTIFNASIEEINDEDYQRIEILKRIFLNGDCSNLNVENNGFIKMNIADSTILLFSYQESNKSLNILNGCNGESLSENIQFMVSGNEGHEKAVISPYTCNTVKDLYEMENFQLEDAKESYLSIDYNSNLAREHTNQHLLEYLSYYDHQVDKNEDILLMLEEVFQYIRSFIKNIETYYINQMQVVKRMREFTPEEQKEILERKNKAEDIFTFCGYLLLMDNKMEFDIYFDKLTQEEKESLKKFPIYNLFKLL